MGVEWKYCFGSVGVMISGKETQISLELLKKNAFNLTIYYKNTDRPVASGSGMGVQSRIVRISQPEPKSAVIRLSRSQSELGWPCFALLMMLITITHT